MIESQKPLLPVLTELWQQTLGWQPTLEQQQQLQRLYELILEGNAHLNLTRITDPQEFWEKHLWDSLSGVAALLSEPGAEKTVIDIGTGGGFPGLPIALIRPDWSITLLDATQKKITFLEMVKSRLELTNVRLVCDRAERFGQQLQERRRFDLALVRAVGSASVCAEYALPVLKMGGTAILYRGQWTAEEATALTHALTDLGGRLVSSFAWTTPLSQSVRHCLEIEKIAPTPAKFPRAIGVPSRQPL